MIQQRSSQYDDSSDKQQDTNRQKHQKGARPTTRYKQVKEKKNKN